MKSIITIGIILLNIFSLIITVKMLTGMEPGKKLISIIGGEIGILILTIILYALSGSGVLDSVHQGAKWYIILTMLPVNMLLIYCPIISGINNKLLKNSSKKDGKKSKILMWIILDIVIIIIEVMYVKNIQLGITNLGN